jgi:arylsulfatase A-like enzyme
MLTGKLQHAHHTLRITDYPMAEYDPQVLPFWPAVFRQHGYETAMIGKWHLGADVGHGRDWDYSVIWDRGQGNSGAYYHGTLVRHNGGQLQNTLIVYTSDQGFAWGQHGFRHKWAPYDANLCAPMICHWPASIPAGTVCQELVSGLDIVRTFHSVAGIEPAWRMHGRDLAALLSKPQGAWQSTPMLLSNTWRLYGEAFTEALAGKQWQAMQYAGSRTWLMMRKGPYKYIRYTVPGCIEELYHLENDPDELDNLAVQQKHHERLLQFRQEAEQEFRKREGGFVKHLPKPSLKSASQ